MGDLHYVSVQQTAGSDEVPAHRWEDDVLDLPPHCFLSWVVLESSGGFLSKQRFGDVKVCEFTEESLEAIGL